MAGFAGIADVVDAELAGRVRYSTWRKTPTQTTPVGMWFDLSMSPGNPVPQYYAAAPLNAIALAQSTDGGLFHGGAVSPLTKCVRMTTSILTNATPAPVTMILMDYLMYYPFIDEGTTDPQVLGNVVTIPRYTTGAGVQIMAVSVAGRTGGQSFFVTYTNSDGVGGRTSKTVIQNLTSVTGSIVTSDRNGQFTAPFIPLQTGDTGVRSIESVTMLGVDVGLFTLVLVKPLAQSSMRGIDAAVEVDYLRDFSNLPIVKDDAYLNWICMPLGSMNGLPMHGDILCVWN